MAPLVDTEAFDHLVKGKENKNYLPPLLFPDEGGASCLPKGIFQLHHMLHSKDPTCIDEILVMNYTSLLNLWFQRNKVNRHQMIRVLES